ncbi:MAG: exopolyphosphatase [Clostridiales bacterium]|nr:exopolyphosphatase [Clostridiales bacterium]
MRLLTRSDFDGLACGAILKAVGVVDSWKFVHPKDMQDGVVQVTGDDVLANVPYVEGCGMWFDHHFSETARLGKDVHAKGEYRLAPSAARVVYEYYGGDEKLSHFEDLVKAVDKVDSGQLTRDDIYDPQGWILLGFIMDPRTGLGRFKEFSIPNYRLMENLMDVCATMGIGQILAMTDVVERVEVYRDQTEKFKGMVNEHTEIKGNVILTDLRDVSTIYVGNRFMVYSIYPEQNVSVWVVDGKMRQNCAIAVGYSILNKTCNVDIGLLMLKHGGGGHKMVGTCQVPYEKADEVIEHIIRKLNENKA